MEIGESRIRFICVPSEFAQYNQVSPLAHCPVTTQLPLGDRLTVESD